MKLSPPATAPAAPRKRQAQRMANWVEAGPGNRFVAETLSSNSEAEIQLLSSTHSRRRSAMWVGGPPKPMQPIRPHSRTMVERDTAGRSSTARFCHRRVVASCPTPTGNPRVPSAAARLFARRCRGSTVMLARACRREHGY